MRKLKSSFVSTMILSRDNEGKKFISVLRPLQIRLRAVYILKNNFNNKSNNCEITV